jgi:hypothetical protein
LFKINDKVHVLILFCVCGVFKAAALLCVRARGIF